MPAAERDAALGRIVGDYLRRAVDADRAVSTRWRHGPAYAEALPPVYGDAASALDALERDRSNLVAAVRLTVRSGRHDAAWQLCEALWGLFFMRRHFADWIETYGLGVEAAAVAGDPVAHARMRLHLGFAYFQRNVGADDEAEARTGFEAALRLAESAGRGRTISSTFESLGLLALRTGDPAQAARTSPTRPGRSTASTIRGAGRCWATTAAELWRRAVSTARPLCNSTRHDRNSSPCPMPTTNPGR